MEFIEQVLEGDLLCLHNIDLIEKQYFQMSDSEKEKVLQSIVGKKVEKCACLQDVGKDPVNDQVKEHK